MDTNVLYPRRANKPKSYNTLGKKPKKFKNIGCLKDGTVQHWDKDANGKRGGWRPKKYIITI